MRFSITTDIRNHEENAVTVLAAFASAGFDAAHWCQNWMGKPVFYDRSFIDIISQLIAHNNLEIPDVHSFCGSWGSGVTSTRELQLAVNINRMEFAQAIGADVLVMHLPFAGSKETDIALAQARKDITDLLPACKESGVALAIENLSNPAHNHEFFDSIFDEFDPNYVGFCYDSGHALLADQEDFIERYSPRLIATHLHDNDGTADQHLLCGEGIADWKRIMQAIKKSNYAGSLNLEVGLPENENLDDFCKKALERLKSLWAD